MNHRSVSNITKGFTLIELLVVISIVSLLSSVIVTSFNDARLKARDSLRVSQMKEIYKAMELYYFQTGTYPPCTSEFATNNRAWCSRCPSDYDQFPGARTAFQNVLEPLVSQGVIATIPVDPLNGPEDDNSTCYAYEYWENRDEPGYGEMCGALYIEDYEWVIRFSTEKQKFVGLTPFTIDAAWWQNNFAPDGRAGGKEYCIHGPLRQ